MKWLLIIGSGLMVTLISLYPIPYTLYPAFASVDLREVYAFSGINSLADGIRLLIYPAFVLGGILVIFYFLIGAFKYLVSKGDKNELEGAKNMMTHSIVGFIILTFVFLIMQYLAEFFGIPNII
jgi:hypothetical protein